MHPQQEPCQDSHQTCMGRIYGDSGGHPPYPWGQGYLCPEEGDHREDLRDCERTTRVPLYTIHREGTDGDESRAYFCVHGLKKTSKDPCQKGERGVPSQEHPYILKKIYLKIKERCWSLAPAPLFVYSLTWC